MSWISQHRILAVAAVLALAVAVLAVLPPVRDRVTAAAVLAEAVSVDVPRPFAEDVQRRETVLPGGARADLYDPGDGAAPLLLVPGAAPAGRDDERVVRLATALARSDLTVLVPELDIYRHRFAESDLEVLVNAVRLLARGADDDVTVLGISFGGSLALVTAADPRIRDTIGTVATFGAYADMLGLLQAAATGVSIVDGERYPWDPPPQAKTALRSLALELTPQPQRGALTAALASGDAAGLPPAARAAYRLVTAQDPAAVPDLVAALPAEARDRLRRFSPAAVASDVRAEVLAMHSRDDPAVPYAELRRMRAAFPDAHTYTVESFRHVDLRVDGNLVPVVRDVWTILRFASELLEAAR